MLHVIDFDQLKIENQQYLVGRCMLTPGWTRVGRAWFQRLKLKYDEPLSNVAFSFNLRRYNLERIEERNNELLRLKLTTGKD